MIRRAKWFVNGLGIKDKREREEELNKLLKKIKE